MPDDALDVSKMNVNPGGAQQVMRVGWWAGKPHKMNYALGVPKGMRVVLEEGSILKGLRLMMPLQGRNKKPVQTLLVVIQYC